MNRYIEAPGVQITEKDLSEYTPSTGGSTALVMGFANAGQSYEPVEFTSKNAVINYFGKPTNEAERYFYAACSEVLSQNGKLIAAKLPYDNESADKHVVAQYKVNTDENPIEISSLTDVLSINNEAIYGDTTLSTNSAFVNDLREAFFGGFRATEADSGLVASILSTSEASVIYERIADVFNSRNIFISDNALTGTTGIFLSSSPISNYIVKNDEDFLSNDISSTISVENGEVSSYFTTSEYENIDILSVGFQNPEFVTITIVEDNAQFVRTSLKLHNIFEFLGTYKSIDGFKTVNRTNMRGIRKNRGCLVAVSKNTLFDLWGNELMRSIDGGKTWTSVYDFNSVYDEIVISKISAKNSSEIFALIGNSNNTNIIIKSNDGGLTWEPQFTNENAYFTDIATLDGTIAVAIDTEGNIFKVSSGSSWQIISEEALGENCSAIAIRDDDTIYVIQDGVLLKSTDGGGSFSEVNSEFEFVGISVGTGSSDTIYAITKTEILKSSVGNESEFEFIRGFSNATPISSMDVRGYSAIYQGDYDALPPEEQARYHRSSASTLVWTSMTDLVKEVLSTASISRFTEYFSNSSLSSVIADSFKKQKDAYALIRELDDSISTYNEITFNPNLSTITTNELDYLVTGEQFLTSGNFVIVDKLGGQYTKTSDGKEVLGVIPVVTTAANAMYFQNLIDSSETLAKAYSSVSAIYNNTGEENDVTLSDDDLAIPFTGNPMTTDSLSERASNYFPSIGFISEGELDKEHMKDIGVVVFRAYVDSGASNKVNFDVLEVFVGSLDKNAKNPATNVTKFIETIVNSQSEYIYLFANVGEVKGDMLAISNQPTKSMGFTEKELQKDISVAKLMSSIDIVFQKNEDIYKTAIDYVVDAGISNIGQYIADVYEDGKGPYEPCGENSKMFKLRSDKDKQQWLAVLQRFDNFCKNTRKDCLFLADGIRPLVLQGAKKVVRPTKPSQTIDSAIAPNIKYLAGLNTNYGAGYANWFLLADEFTGETFWCPPSVQACGCNIFTDLQYDYFYPVAGLKRGVVSALDCSFNPSNKQAAYFYNRSWNYAIDYADVGIILEGQKTLTQKKSAFDRISQRKTFLRLERIVYNIARQFIYEVNNAYTRQRFVDRLTPVFQDIQARGGIMDFRILCDESINTPEIIDNNELRAKIGLKVSKSIEWVLIEFVALRTGASWAELTTA